jgi:HEAT repeat
MPIPRSLSAAFPIAMLLSIGWLGRAPASGAAPERPSEADATLATVGGLVESGDHAAIGKLGDPGIDALVTLYRAADVRQKEKIAGLLYAIGKPSAKAELALMEDAHTPDVDLRINVQYALGRVSGDDRVVDVLLDNMRHDPSPLIRDKAACALAYDQIHLTELQKVRLFAGLIKALDDENPQVRSIAAQALKIHTGQTKGYHPRAPQEKRREAIVVWQRWLLEYRRNLE